MCIKVPRGEDVGQAAHPPTHPRARILGKHRAPIELAEFGYRSLTLELSLQHPII